MTDHALGYDPDPTEDRVHYLPSEILDGIRDHVDQLEEHARERWGERFYIDVSVYTDGDARATARHTVGNETADGQRWRRVQVLSLSPGHDRITVETVREPAQQPVQEGVEEERVSSN